MMQTNHIQKLPLVQVIMLQYSIHTTKARMIRGSKLANMNLQLERSDINDLNQGSHNVLREVGESQPDRLSGISVGNKWRSRFQARRETSKDEEQPNKLENPKLVSDWRAQNEQKIKARLKQKRKQKSEIFDQCPVCFTQWRKQEMRTFGICQHKFCSACLQQQIQSCIKNFKVINCMIEDCLGKLQIQSPHIQSLNINQQERYYKTTVFANLATDPRIKLCPTDGCEGFIDIKQEVVICAICSVVFCRKCSLPLHDGDCDQNGANFMQDNYHFRKCDQCKMVLQKNQGCNHMTCRCGYQFCYLCGGKWSGNHKCGSPPPPEVPQTQLVRRLASIQLNQQQIYSMPPTRPPTLPPTLPPISIPIQPPAIMSNGNANQANPLPQNPPPNRTCLSYLKCILVGFLAVLINICSCEIVWTLILLIIAPIGAFIIILFWSMHEGFINMINRYDCIEIALGNIFLLLLCIGKAFCQQSIRYMTGEIWNCIWKKQVMFPFTNMLINSLNFDI